MMSGLHPVLAFTDADGWHLGIGDPTVMGWVTVLAYLWAAYLCFRVAQSSTPQEVVKGVKAFWMMLGAMLLLLGINKQLDLQTWLTFSGKRIAQAQGWYEQRKYVQAVFIAGIALCAGAAAWWGWRIMKHQARELWLPLAGFCALLGFVVIRAASFHHVDQMLHFSLAGFKLNWLLELGGIGIVIAGARRACRLSFAKRTSTLPTTSAKPTLEPL